jgi:uncharacterized protein
MSIRAEHLVKAADIAREFGATRLLVFGSAAHDPAQARDLDLACEGVIGWRLYALGARLEQELRIPLDLITLTPSSRLTRLIEQEGRDLV